MKPCSPQSAVSTTRATVDWSPRSRHCCAKSHKEIHDHDEDDNPTTRYWPGHQRRGGGGPPPPPRASGRGRRVPGTTRRALLGQLESRGPVRPAGEGGAPVAPVGAGPERGGTPAEGPAAVAQ